MGLNQWADDRADDGQGTGDRPVPRHGRAALLRLAAWFEEAEPDRADALATAAFALHPARQLEGRVDESVAATTSWWQAEPDRSTVTEHPGTRLPEPVRDHRAQQARLRDAAESSAHWRRAGAEQIRDLLTEPTGDRARLDLSGAGMEVLMELLTNALGSGDASRRPTSAGDLEFGLRLHVHAAPGAEVTVRGEGGDLTLEGLCLRVTSYEQHTVDTSGPVGTGPAGGPEPSADPAPPAAPGVSVSIEPAAAPDLPADPEPSGGTTTSVSGAVAAGTEPPVPEQESAEPPAPLPPAPGVAARTALDPDRPLTGTAPEPATGTADEPHAPPVPWAEGPPADSGDEPEPVDGPEPFTAPGPGPTDGLPGPDPDVETTGPIDIVTNTPWTRRWG